MCYGIAYGSVLRSAMPNRSKRESIGGGGEAHVVTGLVCVHSPTPRSGDTVRAGRSKAQMSGGHITAGSASILGARTT